MQYITAGLLAVVGPVAAASGAIVYTEQQRSITATASADFGAVLVSESQSAPDFGSFNHGLEVVAFSTSGQHSGTGRAYMESTLNPLGIVASGGWSGLRSGGPGGLGGGTSSFSVGFLLDAPIDFTLSVGLVSDPFHFVGPDGFIIDQPGNHAGTLQPGAYSLWAYSSGQAGFPPSGGGFHLVLTLVPTPAAVGLAAPLLSLLSRRRRPA